MKTLKIAFAGFWDSFVPQQSFIYHILKEYYNVEFSEEPDIVFYEAFGDDHRKYNTAIKVFATNENLYPNFNECDYAIGYKMLEYNNRYMRRVYSAKKKYHLPKII